MGPPLRFEQRGHCATTTGATVNPSGWSKIDGCARKSAGKGGLTPLVGVNPPFFRGGKTRNDNRFFPIVSLFIDIQLPYSPIFSGGGT